jgi:hypothetical protein
MNWVDVASNQCFSGNTLQNAVNNGYFVLKSAIPANGRMITKDGAQSYVYINPIPSKASNQLVVKSNLTAASLLPYSYTLFLNGIDGNVYIGYTTSGGACASTFSVTVYSNSSSIAVGTALYYDAYGTERLYALPNASGCGNQIYYRIGGNYITFQASAALQCDGYIINSIGSCSGIVYLFTACIGSYPCGCDLGTIPVYGYAGTPSYFTVGYTYYQSDGNYLNYAGSTSYPYYVDNQPESFTLTTVGTVWNGQGSCID